MKIYLVRFVNGQRMKYSAHDPDGWMADVREERLVTCSTKVNAERAIKKAYPRVEQINVEELIGEA